MNTKSIVQKTTFILTLFFFSLTKGISGGQDLYKNAVSQITASFPEAVITGSESAGDYLCIHFTSDSICFRAYYNNACTQLALAREMNQRALPIKILIQLKKRFPGYRSLETFEVDHKVEGIRYFVLITDGKHRKMVTAEPGGDLAVYQKNISVNQTDDFLLNYVKKLELISRIYE
jgi:hypothetical protein